MRTRSSLGTKASRTSSTVSCSVSCTASFRRSSSSSRLRGCTSRVMACANDSKLGARPWRRSTRGSPWRSRYRPSLTQCANSSLATERCGNCCAARASRITASRRATSRRLMPVVVLMRLTLRCGNKSGCAASAAPTKARRTSSSIGAYGSPRCTASSASGSSTRRSAASKASCSFISPDALRSAIRQQIPVQLNATGAIAHLALVPPQNTRTEEGWDLAGLKSQHQQAASAPGATERQPGP